MSGGLFFGPYDGLRDTRIGDAGMLSFTFILQALLLTLGIVWCGGMAQHWRDHVAELREGKVLTAKIVLVGLWMVTAVVAVGTVWMMVRIIQSIAHGIRLLL
jgi:hypothetical protein